MALKIVWTDEAVRQLKHTIEYLEYNWSETSIKIFLQRLDQSLTAIQSNPETYKDSQRKIGLKEFQMTPHNTIFYTFNENHVHIVSIWPNKKF